MNKRRLFQQLSIVLMTTLCLFSSCKNDEEEEYKTVIFTAELVSAMNCSEDFINYARSICNSVHQTTKFKFPLNNENKADVFSMTSYHSSNIYYTLRDYRQDHGKSSAIYTYAILVKDASGELIYKYTREYKNDKTNSYETWYK